MILERDTFNIKKSRIKSLMYEKINNTIIYLWLCWVFVALRAFLQLWCMGFSLQWLLLLQSRALGWVGSVAVAHGPSCSMACGILIPGSGIKPISPASAGRLPTTGPPGKSLFYGFDTYIMTSVYHCVIMQNKFHMSACKLSLLHFSAVFCFLNT